MNLPLPLSISASNHKTFRKRLLAWFEASKRDLPWRRDRNPYTIWISEVMLQQTRVATAIPYFERFIARFPTIEALASAPEEDLLKAWAGLGYYSRARNLQRAAIQMNASFPRDYDSIRTLPGVGAYTAAAVASIAFGLPHAAVDGNVVRVLSRVTGGIDNINDEADARLDTRRPGDFNEAMMELGATICLPKKPQCLLCPIADLCQARASGRQDDLPVRRRSRQIRVERLLLIIRRENEMLFWRRSEKEKKLAGFWELPEHSHLPEASVGRSLGRFSHSITNVNNVFTIAEAGLAVVPPGYSWLSTDKPLKYLFSTSVRKALHVISKTEGV
jgi:A/G-specific adenine glycosylase